MRPRSILLISVPFVAVFPLMNRELVRCKCFFCVIQFLCIAMLVFWQITLEHTAVLHFAYNQNNSLGFASPERAENATVVNPHPYMFIINKPKLCDAPGEVLVVVVVITGSTHFEQRIAIRATWGRASLQQGFKVANFIGLPKDKSIQPLIEAEDSVYRDIIQENFTDTYENGTLKSIMMVRWITEYCSKAKFVLKIDDDVMLNPGNLWAEVTSSLRNFTMTAWGVLAKGRKPFRDPSSKYYLSPSMYKSEVLPDMLFGPAYMFTGDCAPVLYNLSFTVPLLWLEDIYLTGMVAKKAGIRLIGHAGFSNRRKFSIWSMRRRQITSHGYKPLDMLRSLRQFAF
ncbi:beta-1,3-galactosyltransferase 1-like [Ornithodoros turicata]|uniref:beta-1,3-galactosyltransferase 1-like n=1 Tax=Ornithodoros turicata TaxID=34597 RepID=UPI0031389AD1